MTHIYEKGTPAGCPPKGSSAHTGKIYRGIKRPDKGISCKNFASIGALRMECHGDECQCWGLSVWVNKEDFEHARDVMKWLQKWALVEIEVCAEDGRIKQTPTNNQDEHYTFWKNQSVDWVQKAVLVSQPNG